MGIFGSPPTAPPSELSSLALTSSGHKNGSEGSDKNPGPRVDVALGANAAPATRTTVVTTNESVVQAFAAPTQTQTQEPSRSSRGSDWWRNVETIVYGRAKTKHKQAFCWWHFENVKHF